MRLGSVFSSTIWGRLSVVVRWEGIGAQMRPLYIRVLILADRGKGVRATRLTSYA